MRLQVNEEETYAALVWGPGDRFTLGVRATDESEARWGKPLWDWTGTVRGPEGGAWEGSDLAGWSNATGMLSTLLSFVGAALESRAYSVRHHRGEGEREPGENEDLFPAAMLDAFETEADEIGMACVELTESPDSFEREEV